MFDYFVPACYLTFTWSFMSMGRSQSRREVRCWFLHGQDDQQYNNNFMALISFAAITNICRA
jgi:hypothetical protein